MRVPLKSFLFGFFNERFNQLRKHLLLNSCLQCLYRFRVCQIIFQQMVIQGIVNLQFYTVNWLRIFGIRTQREYGNANKLLVGVLPMQFPRFKGGNEEDSQEALFMYHRYSRKSRSRDKTVFYGKKTQETIWPGGKSSHEEDFSIHIMSSRGNNLKEMLRESSNGIHFQILKIKTVRNIT